MKANRLKWFLLFLFVHAVFQLPAQQGEADRKLLADIRAKAEAGDAKAQNELGEVFALGKQNVPAAHLEAANWFRQSAELYFAQAQYNLGVCYHDGQGVAKDYAEAVKWFYKA